MNQCELINSITAELLQALLHQRREQRNRICLNFDACSDGPYRFATYIVEGSYATLKMCFTFAGSLVEPIGVTWSIVSGKEELRPPYASSCDNKWKILTDIVEVFNNLEFQ